MKILAIGATGFIGTHVLHLLINQGHDVAVFHRGTTHSRVPDAVRHIYGKRHNLALYKSQFAQFSPEVVLDVIPFTAREARAVASTFRGLAGRVVALSSGDVYRNYDGLRGRSHHPPDPVPSVFRRLTRR